MSDNQIIERLLSAGGGEAKAFSGFLSTARDERVRLYQAYNTEAFIELSQNDILHIEESEKDNAEAIVYVKNDANIRVVFERELNIDDIREAPARAERPHPDQPSSDSLSASKAGGLTVCAGGLVVVLCAHPVIGPYGHIHWAYKLGNIYLSCGPSMTIELFC